MYSSSHQTLPSIFLFPKTLSSLSLSLSVIHLLLPHPLLNFVVCTEFKPPSDPQQTSKLADMKKIVLRVDLHDDKAKQKAMKAVATLSGIDSIAMEMKERKMTVIGAVDPINVVTKLRKNWPNTDIILVGPAKEPEKPPEKKEEGGKPEEGKKDEAKKEGDGEKKKEEGGKKEGGEDAKKEGGDEKKEEKKKEGDEKKPALAAPVPIYYDPMLEMIKAQRAYNPYMYGHQPYHQPYGGHPYNYHPSAAAHHYVHNVEENPSGTCTIV